MKKFETIEQFFGTLMQCIVESWKKHLKTNKYSTHIALNEFYDEMPDLVDNLIEHYNGVHGKVKDYNNILDSDNMSSIEYLKTLRKLTREGQDKFLKNESELSGDCDAILSQMDSTIYKLENLTESSQNNTTNNNIITYLNKNLLN